MTTDYATESDWFEAQFGGYHFELNGAVSGRVDVIPCMDTDIGIRVIDDEANQTVCYLSPTNARRLALELLRVADMLVGAE